MGVTRGSELSTRHVYLEQPAVVAREAEADRVDEDEDRVALEEAVRHPQRAVHAPFLCELLKDQQQGWDLVEELTRSGRDHCVAVDAHARDGQVAQLPRRAGLAHLHVSGEKRGSVRGP